MRADRLVGVLLLLQRRGQVTAADVAAEFEVSERTARRDLEALGMAGLPVYSVQGRGGGWRLLGDGRTDLSGLSTAEVRALFLMAGPSATATGEVRSALRKLASTLPDPLRSSAEAVTGSVVVDETRWDGGRSGRRPDPPLLDAVQEAVLDGHQLELGYVARTGQATGRTVEPLGLVTKGGWWYLVADTEAGLRTFRVDRVTAAEPTGRRVTRPDGFELAAAWDLVTDRVKELRSPTAARCRVGPTVLGILRSLYGGRLVVGEAGVDGAVAVEIRGYSIEALAGELGGFGARIEVIEPADLRDRLATIGRELIELYG